MGYPVYVERVTFELQCTEMDHYVADVQSAQDYYPFGMIMPGRQYSTGSYKYGFQGQEKDDEVKGRGNSVNFKYRMHDPRIGRFLSIDPLAADYPHNSPYAFSENRVIDAVELEGLEMVLVHGTFAGREGQDNGTMTKADYSGGSTWSSGFAQKLAKATGWTSDQIYEWN